MSIFKRIEVWILLVLTAAGLVFVLLSRPSDGDEGLGGKQNSPSPAKPDKTEKDRHKVAKSAFQKDGLLEIKSVTVKRNQSEYLTEVRFAFDNQSDKAARTIEAAKLITASGKSVPVFFLAFAGAPPNLPAKMKSDASIQFSLQSEEMVGGLTLAIGQHRAPIKSAQSFDPESIAHLGIKTFNDLDW